MHADTHAISDIDNGKLPEWADKPAPDLAKFYWKMAEVCPVACCYGAIALQTFTDDCTEKKALPAGHHSAAWFLCTHLVHSVQKILLLLRNCTSEQHTF